MSEGKMNVKPYFRESEAFKYPRVITIISSSRCARIKIEDIELIEQEGRVLHIVTADRDYSVYESMDSICELLNPKHFYRPIKSLVVNFDHVNEICMNTICFESGQTASMGRNNISKTKTAFKSYLINFSSLEEVHGKYRVAEQK